MARSLFSVFCVLAILLTGLGNARAASQPEILGYRISEQGREAQFTLMLDRMVEYKYFMLQNPDRLVIDLPKAGWKADAESFRQTGKSVILRARYGNPMPGTSRVVFDLQSPVALHKLAWSEPSQGYPYYRLIGNVQASSAALATATLNSPPPRGQPPFMTTPLSRQLAPVPVPKVTPPPKRVVVLDPGHGGNDPGARGRSGIYEKNIILPFAKSLRQSLERTGRYTVQLTRENDRYIPLRERVALARRFKGDIFISLHADSIEDPKTRGLSVYTLSENASDKEAESLAQQENKSDIIAGINLSGESQEVADILIDLAQRETMNKSSELAEAMVGELKRYATTLRNTHRFAGFAVLKSPDVPSILVELGFLSNAEDEKLLRSESYQRKIIQAMVKAMDMYFAQQGAYAQQ